MPRIVGLLLVCNLLCICSCSAGYSYDCDKPLWWKCSNRKCISHLLRCDGMDDCGDKSDEQNCQLHELELLPASFYNQCASDEFRCKNSACIPMAMFCDLISDCTDGSDEYDGCEKELNCEDKFMCVDGRCVSKEWVCDGSKDCPDNSDERNCVNRTLSTSECKGASDHYLCTNLRCISLNMVCNKMDDCNDGSDESPVCEHSVVFCAQIKCTYECKMTPKGPICTCQPGYNLSSDNRTCIDIDECTIYGICDQRCVNTLGSYTCSCITGYTLQSDTRTCKANGGEAMLLFATERIIRGMHLNSQVPFVIQRHLTEEVNFAVDGDQIYWSKTDEHNSIIIKKIMYKKIKVIVTSGLGTVTDVEVDWITGNIYFTDDGYHRIGVCNNNGTYCTIILHDGINKPKAIALLPINGMMYWSDWRGSKKKRHIAMAGMDGKNMTLFVTKKLGLPTSLTIDYPNDRLYWVDYRFEIVESIRLDGTDRRTVLEHLVQHPINIALFENKLYWSDWESRTIQSCDKFSGKDWKILARAGNRPYDMHIDHPAIKSKIKNPCEANPCSQLCLLNQNKGYTCGCTLDKELNPNEHTCRDVKDKQHIIIATSGKFIYYYHELLGKPKYISINAPKHLTTMTYDSISGVVLANDQYTNTIFSYNPKTNNIKDIMSIDINILGGMAFDYLGNNLYLSDMEHRTIQVHSLSTNSNTIFYFNEQPHDIALAPEEGTMFVVFRGKRGHHIDKMQMDGTGARKQFIAYHLDGPKVSLCYDAHERRILWSDQNSGIIDSISFTGSDEYTYSVQSKAPISIAIAGEHLFWTEYNSSRLFWTNRSITYENTDSIAINISKKAVEKPLVVAIRATVVSGEYGCRKNNGNCSHVCLSSSNKSYICACPPGMTLSTDNRTCSIQSSCPPDEIKCIEHNVCIKLKQWCNGIEECPNGEDEQSDCKKKGCNEDQFTCTDGTCINWKEHCNSHYDCPDKSDESDCTEKACQSDEFQCNDGNCISRFLQCDGTYHCSDFSDELNCATSTCSASDFMCKTHTCIPKNRVCDGESDCPDGSDESENCKSMACGDDMFTCLNGRCIPHTSKCDGFNDCGDESDEQYCPSINYGHSGNCTEDEYQCYGTDMCVSRWMMCDGVRNCPRNDDENYCVHCHEKEFTCNSRLCIPKMRVCDGVNNCGDNSDEMNCSDRNATNLNVNASTKCEDFRCSIGICLPFEKVCNSIQDCPDGSDENGICLKACLEDDCEDLCQKTPKGGVCGCRRGYRLGANMRSCEDINECDESNTICSQICHNTVGSFSCSCFKEYNLRHDGVTCKALGPPMKLIIITNQDIMEISANLSSIEVILHLPELKINGFDVNAIDDAIYWSADKSDIKKFDFKTREVRTLKFMGKPRSLATDWVTKNIYFYDQVYPNKLKVCNIRQQECATLIKIQDLASITSLAIDPRNRLLFWSQSIFGAFGKIYRANMIGSDMRTIVINNISYVSGMAIDFVKSRLYWADNLRTTIESVNFDGSQRRIFLNASNVYSVFSISIYEDNLYWLMASVGKLQKCNLYGEKSCETINLGAKNVQKYFGILHISKHPIDTNICEKLNCNNICVALGKTEVACISKDGKPLKFNITDKGTFSNSVRLHSRTFGLFITIAILILVLLSYFYYRKKLRPIRPNNVAMRTVHFFNPSYGREEQLIISDSYEPSSLVPGEHEYTNPVNPDVIEVPIRDNLQRSEMYDVTQNRVRQSAHRDHSSASILTGS